MAQAPVCAGSSWGAASAEVLGAQGELETREQGMLVPHTGLCLALLSTISAQEMSQELAGASSLAPCTPCQGFAGSLGLPARAQVRVTLRVLTLPGAVSETWGAAPPVAPLWAGGRPWA